jgi:lipopolysaccharide export LptBFGC system permease protein LptF
VTRRAWLSALALAALGSGANAAWMLAAPESWYRELPADVPATGPFNAHLVRDVGCAFAMVALALAWAALRPRRRPTLVTMVAVFLVGHAGVHLFDTARGLFDAHHVWLDLPSVYVPAVLAAAASLVLLRAEHASPERVPHERRIPCDSSP